MRYKDIARRFILDKGAGTEMDRESGREYHPDGRPFTDKQLEKLNGAREVSVDWLRKKWKLEE